MYEYENIFRSFQKSRVVCNFVLMQKYAEPFRYCLVIMTKIAFFFGYLHKFLVHDRKKTSIMVGKD